MPFGRRYFNVWSLEGHDDSRFALCSFPCLEAYLEVLDPGGDLEVSRAELRAGSAACVYCAGCGGLIAPAALCIIHTEAACPEFSWNDATAMQREFQRCWREELLEEVPDDAWALADSVAAQDPTLRPEDLVAIVVGMMPF